MAHQLRYRQGQHFAQRQEGHGPVASRPAGGRRHRRRGPRPHGQRRQHRRQPEALRGARVCREDMAGAAVLHQLPAGTRARVRPRFDQSGGAQFQSRRPGAEPARGDRPGDHGQPMNATGAPSLGAELAAAFVPNRVVSHTALEILIAAEAFLFLLVWWQSPFVVLPRPNEVLSAIGPLWMNQGLGPELWTSFKANVEALAITLVISLGLSYLTVLPAFRPIVTAVSKGRFIGLTGLTFIFTLIFGGGQNREIGEAQGD